MSSRQRYWTIWHTGSTRSKPSAQSCCWDVPRLPPVRDVDIQLAMPYRPTGGELTSDAGPTQRPRTGLEVHHGAAFDVDGDIHFVPVRHRNRNRRCTASQSATRRPANGAALGPCLTGDGSGRWLVRRYNGNTSSPPRRQPPYVYLMTEVSLYACSPRRSFAARTRIVAAERLIEFGWDVIDDLSPTMWEAS